MSGQEGNQSLRQKSWHARHPTDGSSRLPQTSNSGGMNPDENATGDSGNISYNAADVTDHSATSVESSKVLGGGARPISEENVPPSTGQGIDPPVSEVIKAGATKRYVLKFKGDMLFIEDTRHVWVAGEGEHSDKMFILKFQKQIFSDEAVDQRVRLYLRPGFDACNDDPEKIRSLIKRWNFKKDDEAADDITYVATPRAFESKCLGIYKTEEGQSG